jgi:CHAD domain-containing protein
MDIPVFQLQPHEDPGAGLNRIVLEQIDLATWHVDRSAPTEEDVHEYRRACRRIRSAIRLVRDADESFFRHENSAFRDAARVLSPLRSTSVMAKTVHRLVDDGIVDGDSVAVLQHYVTGAASGVRDQTLDHRESLTMAMADARRRFVEWEPPPQLVPTSLGLERTYTRGRDAMAKAYASPAAPLFHDWRKRVKYLQHQMEVLSASSPSVPETVTALGKLSKGLGLHHDLEELLTFVGAAPFLFGSSREQRRLAKVLQRQQRSLLRQLRPVGGELYAERPAHLVDRLTHDWESWRAAS